MKNNDKVNDAGNNAHITINSLYSFFNHSCDPNVMSPSTKTGRVEILAAKDIPKGAEVFVSYISFADLKLPTSTRQQRLMPWLARKCACTRCKASA
jgi:SET domain-containing protein